MTPKKVIFAKKNIMPRFRFLALEELLRRQPVEVTPPSDKISDYFASEVFHINAMKSHLSKDAFQAIEESIESGSRIPRKIADQVASAMKAWAMSKGVTHYTHWFQPLTGATAEKHDAFFEPTENGASIEKFDGSLLVQQEPDASSFPNGGIRNTFEARGYTAWDPSSPAFIIDKTLCIPTIFIAYTGESLDNKMPLLKALNAVDKAATAVCQYFDKNVTKVQATLGWEQEYFLVDAALFNARPDLMLSGRALFGHTPAKGQQLDDHYFGAIPSRVKAFMHDFETRALQLGIPVRTRHNEVAPGQFECAPIFEEANLANDHNLLLMDVLERTARKHNFRVLLHEKPFAGLNGSGKHNNWSLSTNTGVNLLAPGKTPKTNLVFLTFFVNVIKAIYDNADILRASIASASNDHRLGANEAPPAIISVFIGSQLSKLLDDIESNDALEHPTPEDKTELKLNIGKIPELLLDNTDRNRTSPFAFTGNKFEFRAVGSTANCAEPMFVLNTIMAKQLQVFKVNVDKRIKSGVKKDIAILQEIKELIIASKNIRFEGNGYGEEWVKEAAKRGLSNIKETPKCLSILTQKDTVALFEELEVLTKVELEARNEIKYEEYTRKIQIESRIMGDLAHNHILPKVFEYQNKLITNVKGLIDIYGEADGKKMAGTQMQMIREITMHVNAVKKGVDEMIEARKAANGIEDMEQMAVAYCDKVKPYFEDIRYHVDKLEILVDDEYWPLPKTRELLFSR